MACLRCRLKPIGTNNYGTWIEYAHAMPETEPDEPFPMPIVTGAPPKGVRGPRICQHCGTVYCEPVKEQPVVAPAGPPPPVPPIVPRPPIR